MAICDNCRRVRRACSSRFTARPTSCSRCRQRGIRCSLSKDFVAPASGFCGAVLQAAVNPGLVDSISAHKFQILPSELRIKKVLISLDLGSSNVKACFKIVRVGETDSAPRILRDERFLSRSTETISFDNGNEWCPSQLAFLEDDLEYQSPLWGFQINKAIRQQRLRETDVLRHLKPQLYAEDIHNSKSGSWHSYELIPKLEKMLPVLRRQAGFSEAALEDHNSTSRTPKSQLRHAIIYLWIVFQRLVWNYVLSTIWKKYGNDLSWEEPPDANGYKHFHPSKLRGCAMEVALAIPAGVGVEHVELALRTARKAGIINPTAVAEPSAASSFIVQQSFEATGQYPDRRAYLYGDLGGGSFDVVGYQVMQKQNSTAERSQQETNLCMKELIPGRNNWLGAATINKEFCRILSEEIDLKAVVMRLNDTSPSEPWTVSRLLRHFEDRFEEPKVFFTMEDVNGGLDSVIDSDLLRRVDFQQKSPRMTLRDGRLTITSWCMEEIFSPCLHGIMSLIDQQLAALAKQKGGQATADNQSTPVRNLYILGGGAGATYLTDKLRSHYGTWKKGHQVLLRQQSTSRDAFLMVCWGALLLLADDQFIGERISRKGYCFSWDEDANPSAHYEQGRTYTDPISGRRFKKDAAKWLLRVGDRIQDSHQAGIQGERYLAMQGTRARRFCEERNENYWIIEEVLYSSSKPGDMRDGTWVCSDLHKIDEVGVIAFRLYDSELKEVPVTYPNRQPCKLVQYKSSFIIDRSQIHWWIQIPKSGTFDKPELGFACIEGNLLDCRGIFQLFETGS